MKIFSKNTYIAASLLLAVLFCPGISRAEKAKITVDKGILNLSSQAGKDAEFSFSVRNDSPEKQTIRLAAVDIALGDDNAMTIQDTPGGPSSLVVFQENNFVLGENETKKISGTVRFSQEKEEASFYNMLIMVSFSSAEEKTEISGPQIQGKIGVYAFVKIGENHNASGQIEKISLARFFRKSQDIQVSYGNTGDVYFVPRSQVVVKNIFSNFQKEIVLDQHFVFPGKKVSFSGELEGLSPWGFFQVKTIFVDGNGKADVANKYMCGYFFPAGVILVLAMGLFLILFVLRQRNQIKVEMMGKNNGNF